MAITIDGTNGLTTDNAALKLDGTTLTVDDTNNRVGIGTSSPVQKTHLDGGAGDTYFQFSNSTTGSTSSDGSRIGIASADTTLRIQNLESASIRFDIAGSEKLRILSSGGITFNGDTAAANALDDYEEGTWTPTITFGGGNTGLSVNTSGIYTKVGRLVTVVFGMSFTSKGSSTGNFAVSNLPFSAASGTNASGVMGFNYNWVSTTNAAGFTFMAEGTSVYLMLANAGGFATHSEFNDNTSATAITITYFAS